MLKVLNEGKERIEKELNIVKIMKSVRDIKILMKHSMMSPDVRFQVAHSVKNFIDIEIDSDEEIKNEHEMKDMKKK
jgi:hypothetical protein